MSNATVVTPAQPSHSASPEPFELGDYVPRIDLPDPAGRRVSLMNQTIAGGIVVLFCPTDSTNLTAWTGVVEALHGLGGRLFVVTPAAVALSAPLEGLIDRILILRQVFGIDRDAEGVVILDSSGRFAVRLVGEAATPGAVLNECRQLYERTAPHVIAAQSPVIVLPNAITPALCDRLLRYWRDGEKRSGTVARSGNRFAYDVSIKQREDVLVSDDALMIELMRAVRWCVVPAMQRAFNCEPAQAEAFRIGCYPAGKGY